MRKLLLMLTLAASIAAGAQDYPGEKVEMLDGKELKVTPLSESLQKYGYNDFYTDETLKKKYKAKSSGTVYEALVGKTFKVVSYEPYKNHRGDKKYKLKLENAETGTLYYDYNPKYDTSFKFEVIGGLTFPESFYCDKAVEKESRDPSYRHYEFPFSDGVKLDYGRTDKGFIFLMLTINSTVDETFPKDAILRGVTLTFEDGQTITLPDEKLVVRPRESNMTLLTAVIGFSIGNADKEIDLFKNGKLVKIKLNKSESSYTDGATLQKYVGCATK